MPKKIRELKGELRRAGWILIAGGKGSHTKWAHAKVSRRVTLSGNDGADANPKQERDIANASREAMEAE